MTQCCCHSVLTLPGMRRYTTVSFAGSIVKITQAKPKMTSTTKTTSTVKMAVIAEKFSVLSNASPSAKLVFKSWAVSPSFCRHGECVWMHSTVERTDMITVAVMHTHKAGASKEAHSKCLQTARIQACWLLSHLWILKGSSDNDYKCCVWILHGGKIQSTSPAKRQESTKYI